MATQLTFDEALNKMKENENSQFVLMPKRQHLKLSPKYIGNVKAGVTEQLKTQLSLLSRELEGVPVAFKNIKALQKFGKVIGDQPCLHFDIEADFILFKPTVGCVLKGVINKVGKQHVGCLVHGCFNSWFPRSEVKVPPETDLLGKEVEFTVLQIFSNNRVVSLKGKFFRLVSQLEPEKTGKVDANFDLSQTDSPVSSPMVPLMSSTQIEQPVSKHKKHKKHKKKSKYTDAETSQNSEENIDISNMETTEVSMNGDIDSIGDETCSFLKHKKKKKHKKSGENVKELSDDVDMTSTVQINSKSSKRKLEQDTSDTVHSGSELFSPTKKLKKGKEVHHYSVSDLSAGDERSPSIVAKHKKSKKKKHKLEAE